MRDIYDIETEDDAISAYTERFGGFPYFLFMSAEEDYISSEVVKALETDREIEAEEGVIY